MNLALLPITALLLLLSGVGAPAHAADQRQSATALIKAILANSSKPFDPFAPPPFAPPPFAARALQGKQTPFFFLGEQNSPQREERRPVPSLQVCAVRAGNRKAYRTRFGFVRGAYQPQGPPSAALHARLS